MKKIICLSLFCAPLYISAQGFQVQAQGQKQQGMGNTGTALIKDEATIFYNPGGMSFLKENSVSMGGNAAIVNTAFKDYFTQQVFETSNPISTPVNFYAAYRADSSKNKVLQKLSFGWGVYTPFGGAANYPEGWVGRFVLNTFDLKFLNVQPTLSYKVNDKWGVGAGFVLSGGTISTTKDIFLMDSTGFGSAKIEASMRGYGANVGIVYRPIEQMTIGLTYRSAVNLKPLEGTAEFKVPKDLRDSVPDGAVSIGMPTPMVISLGVGYVVNEKFSWTMAANFIGFKNFDTLRIDFEKNTAKHTDIDEPKNFENAYSIHAGAEYLPIENLAVRAGLRYIISPLNRENVTPQGGDADRLAYTLGVGYRFKKWFALDASYSFEKSYVEGGSTYYNLTGTYKTYANIIGLSLQYRF